MSAWQVHLKSQIEVFITTVFLRVLESENSTFEHKRQVLEAVTTFSDTPQALVEIFLSYDCDLHAIDLYNRIVNALSKVRSTLEDLLVSETKKGQEVAGPHRDVSWQSCMFKELRCHWIMTHTCLAGFNPVRARFGL